MNLSPELQLLVINAVILGVAYGGIYPSFRNLTYKRMAIADLVLTGVSPGAAGGLFGGSGVSFSLVLFETNWLVFSLLTCLAMEWPLFHWFCRKRGLRPFDPDQTR
jgi:hypothetical protein